MVLLISLFAAMLAVAIYLLFAPVQLRVRTSESLYRIRFHRMAQVQLRVTGETLILDYRLLFYHNSIDLFRQQVKQRTRAVKKRRIRTTRNPQWMRFSISKLLAVLQSFEIRRCQILIDTGDEIFNALLYPILWAFSTRWIQHQQVDIRVNFLGINSTDIEIQNRLFRVLKAYITA